MRRTATQQEIVEQADWLANQLTVGNTPVERNTLLSIVAQFMADPTSNPARLARMLVLLGQGSGGHLARSPGFRGQAMLVVRVLGDLLRRPNLDPNELRSLLGWTARLLLVRRPSRPDPNPPRPQYPGTREVSTWPPQDRRVPPPRRPTRAVSTPRSEVVSPQPAAPVWRARLQGLGWGNTEPVVSAMLADLKGDQRKEAATEIVARLSLRDLRRREGKSWVQELLKAAGVLP